MMLSVGPGAIVSIVLISFECIPTTDKQTI